MNSHEQFEADCISKGLPFIDRCTEPGYEHQYANPIYQARWEGWQASREALVVKLPAPDDLYEDFKILFDGESGVASTKATLLCGKLQLLLIQALDQAGVRYE